jgi:rhodanese-related sulfurtransferase
MRLLHTIRRRFTFTGGLEEYWETPGAVLLDVRSPGEYAQGHIRGSLNIPIQEINRITVDKESPLLVYCLSGARSASAVNWLRSAGYTAKNIGGIGGYRGEIE